MKSDFSGMFLRCLFLIAVIVITIVLLTPPCHTEEMRLYYPPDVYSPYEWQVCELEENEHIEQAVLANANKIENCTITYYCAEQYKHICGWGLGITATGAECDPGHMVAVDPNVIPLHSQVIIDYGDGELRYYFAEDVGGAIKGNHIDVMCATHEEALQGGKKSAIVYWVAPEAE